MILRRSRPNRLFLMGTLAAVMSSCLGPAQERAERDRAIGRARADELGVSVVGGLACVRSLEKARIVLWQSAPHLAIDIEHKAGRLELEVRNTLPNTHLSAQTDAAEVTLLARPRTTAVRYAIDFPEQGTSRFLLQPKDTTSRPFRVALLSDVQEAIDRVQDIFERINADPSIEFVLGAGDLTQRGSERELARFEAELQSLKRPYYATLGNHELGEEPTPFQGRFGRASFSFRYRGARFTLLDSASATLDPIVLDWLDEWLDLGRDEFHLVGMHIPPVDPFGLRNGSFASRNEASFLLSKLKAAGVNLTVYGHVHSYYKFTNGGIPARISGGGGAIPERFDKIGRHYLRLDIDPARKTFESALVQIDH